MILLPDPDLSVRCLVPAESLRVFMWNTPPENREPEPWSGVRWLLEGEAVGKSAFRRGPLNPGTSPTGSIRSVCGTPLCRQCRPCDHQLIPWCLRV